ncbi:MAG: transporter [Jatrophihabitantaceae bacterium]|nr:transporter [Jatrophihabitantaceae bacterium]
MLAAYGRRISPPHRGGLALAVVSAGAPLGFALGTPLGAALGTAFGWRWAFGGLTVLAILVLALMAALVPDAAGQAPATAGTSLGRVFLMPGIPVVLAVIAVWMLAHNTIYTYIAPYLRATGTGLRPDLVLLVYGVASVVGIGITAALIDYQPRMLLHGSVALFVVAALALLLGHSSSLAVLSAAALWGIAFGGASAQLQSALTHAGREHSDIANSFLPVAFNIAIFAAGISGAVLLGHFNGLSLAALMAGLGSAALLLTIYGRRSAFALSPASVQGRRGKHTDQVESAEHKADDSL